MVFEKRPGTIEHFFSKKQKTNFDISSSSTQLDDTSHLTQLQIQPGDPSTVNTNASAATPQSQPYSTNDNINLCDITSSINNIVSIIENEKDYENANTCLSSASTTNTSIL